MYRYLSLRRFTHSMLLLAILLLANTMMKAQCYVDFYIYQTSPSGSVLCSPQYVTLRVESYQSEYWSTGEFRWYLSETAPTPVHSTRVDYSDSPPSSDYGLNVINGTTVWVTFYNDDTNCETQREPYYFFISPTPNLYQDYARKCGNEDLAIQLSSDVPGVSFDLYSLEEVYDPWYGYIYSYVHVERNSTGYFTIYDFNASTDMDRYYARIYQPYGCTTPYYSKIDIEVTGAVPVTVTGNLSVNPGTSTTLTAHGDYYNFKWYNAAGTFLQYGTSYITPTTLTPDNYPFSVVGVSSDEECVSMPVVANVVVIPPGTTYASLYNSTNFTRSIDLAKPVGTINGEASSSATGAATYSIPITGPPGANGVQPAINISYNSMAGNGVAGFGWDISGLSMISRSGKNVYHDGIVSPISYTSQDRFYLDGVRLNVMIGTNGADQATYAQEAEDFSVILSNTSGTANNPDWFKVTTKDGRILEYGNSADSRLLTETGANVMLWRLNKITDRDGNYIEFKYNSGFRDSRIDQIIYTGNTAAGLEPYNKIQFNYTTRTDAGTTYEGGGSYGSRYLLNTIVITANSSTVGIYEFKYGYNSMYSLLNEVVQKGSDGTTALNSTIFLYGEPSQNITVTPTIALTGSYDFFSGDFNADGKTDLLAARSIYSGTVGLRLHDSYSVVSDIAESSYTLMYMKSLASSGTSVNWPDKKYYNLLTADYDGDGRDDILHINSTKETFSCSVGERRKVSGVSLNYTKSHNPSTSYTDYTEQSITFPTDWLSKQYQYVGAKGQYFFPGDFDGDGNQDFILLLGAKRLAGSCYVFDYKAFLTSPSTDEINEDIFNFGFGANPNPEFYAGTIADADQVQVIDFDGDGKNELLVTKNSSSYILSVSRVPTSTGYSFGATVLANTSEVTNTSRVFPGDFNGDGLTDLLVRNGSTWKILYSTGTAYVSSSFTFNQTPNITGVYSDDKIIVSDFNGDGKSDILHGFAYFSGGVSTSSRFSLYYSRGANNASLFTYEQYTYSNVLAYDGFVVGDFNGDGRSDLLNRPHISSPSDFISFNPFSKERLLVKVMEGHNAITSFDYKLLTDKTSYPYFYTRTVSLDDISNTNPINYVEWPMYAVKSITRPNGIGGNSSIDFKYEDAVLHRTAKGFLGFKKVTSNDVSQGVTTIAECALNLPFGVFYPLKQTNLLTASSTIVGTSDIVHTFTDLSASGRKRYFQHEDKITAKDYFSGAVKEKTSTYDLVGNVLTSVAKVGTISGSTFTALETATTVATYGTYNTPVAAFPENITVTQVRAGMPAQSSITALTYHSNGNCASKTIYSGLPKAVANNFVYNNLGNMVTTTTTATGFNTVTTTQTFDTKGRFALSKKVEGTGVDQTVYATYDDKWGSILTQTSSDCLVTTFEYDVFGRKKKTIFPDANYMTTSNVWDVQPGSIYYQLNDFQGGQPDVKTWYDLLERPTTTQSAGFDNQWLTSQKTYDAKGNVATQTNSYYSGETPITTTYTYDTYNRPLSASNTLRTVSQAYTALSSGNTQVSTTIGSVITQKISDPSGKIIAAIDNGGRLDYAYDSYGNQVEVQHESNVLISKTYDIYGRATAITDKNAGTVTYQYDAKGQLKQQTDNSGTTYNMSYDDLGRLVSKQGPEGTITYEYFKDIVTGCNNNNIAKITKYDGIVQDLSYDALRRLQSEAITIDGSTYTTSYQYNTYGNLSKTTYPSSVEVNNVYNSSGILTSVTGGTSGSLHTLFTATQMDGFGHYTGYSLGNSIPSQVTYDKGYPTRYYTSGIQDLRLSFDEPTGNLLSRNDAINTLTETFEYDNLSRLSSTTLNSTLISQLQYDGSSSSSMGNITAKTDAGTYMYNSQKIHAVDYILNPAGATTAPSVISVDQQDLTYTPSLKTATVTENGYQWSFVYGVDNQRIRSTLMQASIELERKYYLGNYEKLIKGSSTKEIHYIIGGNGMCAIIVKDGSTVTPYAVYTDQLGSILQVTNTSGTVVASQNFDAWGRFRNPATWQYTGLTTPPDWLYRGYTGHEQIRESSLINMNGRMYDPVVGRMLSPDNFIQEPYNTQSFNRYAYTINNPLKYTDPSGNTFARVILMATLDFLNTGIEKGGFAFWNAGSEKFKSAWREFDPTRKGSVVNNAFRIEKGMFATDPNRTVGGNIWAIFSRFTWEAPQSNLGNAYSHLRNVMGNIDNVDYYGGATLVNGNTSNKRDRWGLTLGSYINSRNLEANPFNDRTFRHEYGHVLQSRWFGPLYITNVGVPSLVGSVVNGEKGHGYEWYETGASRLGKRYFERHDSDVLDANMGGSPWDQESNPTSYRKNWYWLFSVPPLEWSWMLTF